MPATVKISVFKNWGGGINQGWVNTYEFLDQTEPPITSAVWQQAVNALVSAEQKIHCAPVAFQRAVVASYQPDGTPYNPSSFVTIPLAVSGSRAMFGEQALDLNAVFNVKRVPASGRNGKLAYRGCLLETDVDATSTGFWKIIPNGPLTDSGSLFTLYLENMQPLLEGSIGPQLVMISGLGTAASPSVSRAILTLVSGTAGFNRMNHRFYDRAPVN